MGLGVLNAGNDEHVPGTSFVLEKPSRTEHTVPTNSKLKYDRSGKEPIVLVPQPSDDPNDPLNWPRWKRDSILAILCLISLIASTLSPLLAANTVVLAFYFKITFNKAALLTGYHLCGVAVAGVIFVPTARVWGKRHLYLLGTILIIVGSAWGGHSTSFDSLIWARVIQGVGLAPFEALVNASVGDLYFVHERGTRMALSNMALFGGAFFTPILVGKITYTLGWQWTFYFIAIFAGALLPLIFFFVPETAFVRPDSFNTDTTGAGNFQETLVATTIGNSGVHAEAESATGSAHDSLEKQHDVERSQVAIPAKISFAQSLKPFNGRKTNESLWKLILRPFPLFLHPAVFWAVLVQGTMIGWTVMIGVTLAALFLGPPLWLDEVQVGYMYTGPFLGAVIGFIVAGLLSDWSTRLMIRRNKGVYEPEFRIVLVVAQLVFGCAGLYGFGMSSNNVATYGRYLPDFFFGLEVMGMVIGAVASALYIVDAHREIAIEAFTCMLLFKNLFSFGLTWIALSWLYKNDIVGTFNILGSVQIGVCLLSVPMYVFGKKNRSFMRRHDLLKLTGLW